MSTNNMRLRLKPRSITLPRLNLLFSLISHASTGPTTIARLVTAAGNQINRPNSLRFVAATLRHILGSRLDIDLTMSLVLLPRHFKIEKDRTSDPKTIFVRWDLIDDSTRLSVSRRKRCPAPAKDPFPLVIRSDQCPELWLEAT